MVNLTAGVLLHQVSAALRQEQLTGTFEALLATPSTGAHAAARSVSFTLLMVPIRAAILLVAIAVGFGLDFSHERRPPALMLLVALPPLHLGPRTDRRGRRRHVQARRECHGYGW